MGCLRRLHVAGPGLPLGPSRRASRRVRVTRANPPAFVDMHVACRKCENCLNRRAAHWRLRASAETRAAPRTWFVTLTYRPDLLFRNLTRTRVRLAKARVEWETLSEHERFIEQEKECFSDVQRWFKRLRKNHGAPFRYLAVTERHKSGAPHFHVLLHEQDLNRPLRYNDALKGSRGVS